MSDFNRIYPPKGKITFDGGLNTKYEKSLIEDNESPDCLNVVLGAGSVRTRDGFAKVNTASVGTYVCDGLYTRRGTSNAETMVAFYGGHGFTLSGTSLATIPSAQSIFTAGVRVCAAQMENHIFVCNGGTIPYKYNGTAFTRHGVYQPITQTVGIISNGAGLLSGVYAYKMTYINSQSVEGNPSDGFATFTVTLKQTRLTSLPVAPQSWGVSTRRLYRTVTSGSTFFRVATISDNTTTTYDDNTADASLGAIAPSDKGVPPIYSAIVYHQNRLFMIGTDGLVWYTDLNEPYTVAALNFLPVGDASTDFPKALASYGDSLAVFGDASPWIVFTPSTDPTTWKTIKAKSAYSSKSPFGPFTYHDKLAFPAVHNNKFAGIGVLNGVALDPSSTILPVAAVGGELKSDRIEPDMFDMQDTYISNFSSIVFNNRAYIAMTKGAGTTTNNRVYMMDFTPEVLRPGRKETWVPWTGLNVAQFTVYNGTLYYGTSTATGYIYKMVEGTYNDDGAAINSYLWTKEFACGPGEESYNKDFRFTNLLADLAGAYFMDLSFRTDSDMGTGTNYPIDLNPGGSLWGHMVWGQDDWGGGASQSDLKISLGTARGKRIQFKFSNQNTVNQRFKVHFQNFTYNIKGAR